VIPVKYTHRFRVKAPLSSVAAFHQQPASMGAITPPPIRAELHRVPATLADGGEMDFTLWFGPLPIHWRASIENVSDAGFTDRQVTGPFAQWEHRHSFLRVDDQASEVIDQISLRLKPHLLWGPVGLGFLVGLPMLFTYRGWKTQRLLEEGAK
jgi:ligand-binding SRPBCC domain-containing protein